MKKGFTLIELMFVVAIAGILTAIVTNSFNTARIRKEQGGIVHGIASHLEKQKGDTQAGKGGSAYGVKFASSTYTLYKGVTYSPSATTNQAITIDTDFSISESISNTSNVIYFSRLTGGANETATITVSEISGKVSPQHILIEASGNISVIE
jgi:prepilin-type N-terminal cleavage/methylation domain-containing protein